MERKQRRNRQGTEVVDGKSHRTPRQKGSSSTMSSTVNADNLDLQPLYAGGSIIGSVDVVNGPSSGDVPEYTPTKAELLELVKYWASTFLNTAYFVFATRQIGSTEMRLCPYADRRAHRIIELLGDDAVEAVREVKNRFAKSVGSRQWKRFHRYLGPNHLNGAADGEIAWRKNAVH